MYLNLKTTRPMLVIVSVLTVVALVCAWSLSVDVPAVGGEDASGRDTHALEERLYDLRAEQSVRARREDILRGQLTILEAAMDDAEGTSLVEYRSTRDELLGLLLDTRTAEQEIAASFRELWNAQGFAERASRKPHYGGGRVIFDWPVEPTLGISAHFDDPGYRARFGFAHQAIDIPVNQDSVVRSIADGVVEKISDQGLGFSSIVIRHKNGYASLYGHVSAFLVSEGDEVSLGDPIARSGGMPGTAGAGRITTGPHLHLELLKDGKHEDPLLHLPPID